MLYLYGDESNTPGADKVWAIGVLFSENPSVHMEQIKKIRKECSYELRELKYSSTDYSQILCAVRFIDYFLSAQDLYFKIIIKDNLFFNKNYFEDNRYGMDKAVLSKCPGIAEKCKMKTNYYWPSFEYQKINVFYWKNKIIASLGKSLSRS